MSYIIKATPPQLFSAANVIETNAEDIRREVEGIRELLDPLRNTFLGNRAEDFFKKYDEAYVDMQQWDNTVRSFAEELRIAANRLLKADTI